MAWKCLFFKHSQLGKFGINDSILMKISLATTPLSRVLIPLITGIIGFRLHIHPGVVASMALFSLLLYRFPYIKKDPYFRLRYHWMFNISLFLLLTSIGWSIAYVHRPAEIEQTHLDRPIFFNYTIEKIEQKNITTQVYGSSSNFNRNPVHILLTLQGNMYDISPGDILCCYGTIEPIKRPTMPEAFDYATYMANQGYLYSAFIERKHYEIIAHEENLHTFANKIKQDIIRHIHFLQLNENTSNFIITILTGEKNYIADDTRELFNDVGLAHILAVSGLHISIIALILNFLLYPFQRILPRRIRLSIILLVIWLYTLITGFSPSATRAAIMTSFVLTALIFYKRNYVLNALCGAAIFTLVFNPAAIYDIGFQLSYLSVLGILFFSPIMTFGKRDTWLRKISSLLALSVSAQIGTLVLSLYYFHSLPLSLLVSNIVIVPLLPLFMLASIMAIILSYCSITFYPLTDFIDCFYQFIEIFTSTLRSLPYSTIQDIWVNDIVIILYYVSIAAICLFIYAKANKRLYLYPLAGIVLSFVINLFINSGRKEKGFILSDDYYSCNFLYYETPKAFIVNSTNDTTGIQDFINRNKSFFIKNNITDITVLTDSFQYSQFHFRYPQVECFGKRIVFVQGNHRKKSPPQEILPVNYLVITKRYYNPISILTKFYQADTIVLPKEIYPTKLLEFQNEIKSVHLPCYDMEQKGALIYPK